MNDTNKIDEIKSPTNTSEVLSVRVPLDLKEKLVAVADHFRGVSMSHAIRILIEDKYDEIRKGE